MKNNKKIISLVATVLFGAASLGLYTNAALASSTSKPMLLTASQGNSAIMKIQPPKCRSKVTKIIRIVNVNARRIPAYRLGLVQNKHLSQQDAKTIIKAALLMQNRHDLKVGNIQSHRTLHGKTFYLIRIVNQQNEVVSKVMMNSESGKYRPMRIRELQK